MERITLKQPKLSIPLWGLIHEKRYADNTDQAFGCMFSKSYLMDGEQVEGLLQFTSPLHAEIYRLRLQALGQSGWRRFCTEDSDIEHIIRSLRDERLQLWVVAGFAVSETQQFLLDENQLLMTSSICIGAMLKHDEEECGTSLHLPSEVIRSLRIIGQELFTLGRRVHGLDRLEMPLQWPAGDDEVWDECAADALDRMAMLEYADYQKIWGKDRPVIGLAQYDQTTQKWLFMGTVGQRH